MCFKKSTTLKSQSVMNQGELCNSDTADCLLLYTYPNVHVRKSVDVSLKSEYVDTITHVQRNVYLKSKIMPCLTYQIGKVRKIYYDNLVVWKSGYSFYKTSFYQYKAVMHSKRILGGDVVHMRGMLLSFCTLLPSHLLRISIRSVFLFPQSVFSLCF